MKGWLKFIPSPPEPKQAVEDPPTCARCHEGHLVEKHGKFGMFYGCSRFPVCTATYDAWTANMMYDGDPSDYGEEPH